jgi:hypothetical protein
MRRCALAALLVLACGDDDAAIDAAAGAPDGAAAAIDAPASIDGAGSADAAASIDAAPGTTDAAAAIDGAGDLAVGAECEHDSQCETGVCWDFNDYDPFCFGTVCSGKCESDEECRALAAGAGAASPESARCGSDERCDLVGTGLGLFACAAPS